MSSGVSHPTSTASTVGPPSGATVATTITAALLPASTSASSASSSSPVSSASSSIPSFPALVHPSPSAHLHLHPHSHPSAGLALPANVVVPPTLQINQVMTPNLSAIIPNGHVHTNMLQATHPHPHPHIMSANNTAATNNIYSSTPNAVILVPTSQTSLHTTATPSISPPPQSVSPAAVTAAGAGVPSALSPAPLSSTSTSSSALANHHSPTHVSHSIPIEFQHLPVDQRDYCLRLLHLAQMRRTRHQYMEALQAYDALLERIPNYLYAWNMKGICHKALKDNIAAMEAHSNALRIQPTDWIAHDHLGLIFKETDMLDKAKEQFQLAVTYGPKDCIAHEHLAIILTDLGTKLKLAGHVEKATQSYLDAVQAHPSYYPAYFNLGVVFSEKGQFDKAMKHYHLAVDRNPNYVEALCNIGVIYKNSGKLSQAIEYYEKALKANPNFSIANSNLAIALTDLGTQVKNENRLDEGIALYRKALHYHSKYPAAWYNLGVAYAEKNRFEDAKVCYEMAVHFDPKCAEAYNNLGVIYKDRGNLDQAIHFYNEALKANPRFSQTMNNLGVIYTMLGKLDEAHEFCSKAIKTNPQYAEAHNNLGVLLRDEGRIDEAIQSYDECLKIDHSSRNAGQNRLLAMNSLIRPDLSDAQVMDLIWQAHVNWGRAFAKLYERERETYQARISNDKVLDRPLRVGYISADFFTHSVSYFIEAPLQYADRNITHITCYSNVSRRDKKTEKLQSLAHSWKNIHDLNAKQAADLIQEDKIDILIELTGHTAGNRLDIMALKPAPIQATWIGYPNTTGLPTIDYRFTDSIVDPEDTCQPYSEELIRFNGPFLCYTPPLDAPPVSLTPALAKGFVTFGSFNNLAKVNDRVLKVWSEILKAVPYSRMLIKCKPFASPTVCNKMWQKFAELGIDNDRVDLVGLLPTTLEHLESYSNVDISVDTFPYAGTTTTCEALFMGVPVVTYQRKMVNSHAHNVGATLLSRMEVGKQLIATSEQEYISKAISLAQDIPALQALRQQLRPAFLGSTICDGRTFGRELAGVYRKIWEKYVKEGPRPETK